MAKKTEVDLVGQGKGCVNNGSRCLSDRGLSVILARLLSWAGGDSGFRAMGRSLMRNKYGSQFTVVIASSPRSSSSVTIRQSRNQSQNSLLENPCQGNHEAGDVQKSDIGVSVPVVPGNQPPPVV
jgi:hypothetical protein